MEALASTVLALPASRSSSMRRQHTHLSDEALVALVARGDEAALAELYDRVGRIAFGLALRVLRDERLAEDAVQEAFLAVWRGAATFRADRAKASTWILTLVHRRAVDLVRREDRRRAEPLSEDVAAAATTEATDEAAWLRFERPAGAPTRFSDREALHRHASTLPPPCQGSDGRCSQRRPA
jgi:RNA polymerase sigma-70 factor (ECF subfamily)